MSTQWLYKYIKTFNTRKFDWGKIFTVLAILVVALSFMIYNQIKVNKRRIERHEFGRLTIGITTGSSNIAKGPKTIEYVYFVDDVKYTKWNSYFGSGKDINDAGGRYFVLFSTKDPGNAENVFVINCAQFY